MDEYRARHTAREQSRKSEEATTDRIGNVRLGLAAIAAILVILPLFVREGGPWWALVPVAAGFVALGIWHDRVSARLRRATAAEGYYARELDRVDEKWRTLEDDGGDLVPEDPHLAQLGADLDLFGPASAFQLINRSVTLYGRSTLAAWLIDPCDVARARGRQAAVAELAQLIDVRESLAVAAAGDGLTRLRDDLLLEWAEHADPLPARAVLQVLGILQPILLVATVVVWAVTDIGAPMVMAILAHIATLLAVRRPVERRAARISTPDRALSRYAELLDAIESAGFKSDALVELVQSLKTDGQPASARIGELRRLVERLDARHNVFFSLTIGPILLWDMNLILRAERWQQVVGPSLRGWFRTIGEVEALSSLGAYAYERPHYAMPELTSDAGVFEATQLSHPLIDRSKVVSNDIRLGGPGSVLLLSGSNMSGKSTFLRAIGLANVLGRAGAPVPAQAARLSDAQLVTSIRVSDSLARGASHFYAELERIKLTLDLAANHGGHILYLLDEMLHGTNSKERYIGAVSVIRWLSHHSAMGVVTTHDLELAKVGDELAAGLLTNMHFGDDVGEGKIHFDYMLKSGPVRSTNALRLMREIGIDIDMVAPLESNAS